MTGSHASVRCCISASLLYNRSILLLGLIRPLVDMRCCSTLCTVSSYFQRCPNCKNSSLSAALVQIWRNSKVTMHDLLSATVQEAMSSKSSVCHPLTKSGRNSKISHSTEFEYSTSGHAWAIQIWPSPPLLVLSESWDRPLTNSLFIVVI